MSYVTCLRGLGSGAVYPADAVMNLCPVDGRPVEMVLDLERLAAERPRGAWYDPSRRDMWRFGGLLALDPADPGDARHIVSLGEGATPLVDISRFTAARRGGFRLLLKDEGDAALVVARRHVKISARSGRHYVEDMGSANGTKLNGVRLGVGERGLLEPGDHLWLGGCVLAYDIEP